MDGSRLPQLDLDSLRLLSPPILAPTPSPADLAEYKALVQEFAGEKFEIIADHQVVIVGRLVIFIGCNRLHDHTPGVDAYYEELTQPKTVFVNAIGACGLLRTGPNIVKRAIAIKFFDYDRDASLLEQLQAVNRQLADHFNYATEQNTREIKVGIFIEAHLVVPLLCVMWGISLPRAYVFPTGIQPVGDYDPLASLRPVR